MVIGAVLEVAGLVFVALDVRQSHREVERRTRPDQLVQISPALEHSRALGAIVVVGGQQPEPEEPSLDERVSTLEREVAKVTRDLEAFEERETQAHRELTDRAAALVGEARRETFDVGQDARTFAANVAAGNLRRRVLGVGLFIAGLLLQTAGNLAAL